MWAGLPRAPDLRVGELLGPVDVAGREATMKVCGVVVAMRLGHSWAPPWTSGDAVNVGTVAVVAVPAAASSCCRVARHVVG
jgi:hypothetical protein